MRQCSRCHKRLNVAAFTPKDRRTGALHSWCRGCQKRYKDEHYRKHRADYIHKAKALMRKVQAWITAFKRGKPCKDCGRKFPPCVMDFDHRDPVA